MDKPILSSDCVTCCGLCYERKAKYTCPRCGIRYCSVMCYKSSQHITCSEDFFKECVIKESRSNMQNQCEKNVKTKQENVLKGDGTTDDNDDLDSDDSVNDCHENFIDRMKNVDLNDSDSVWSLLTENERKDFKKKLLSGEVVELLPNWNPWWINVPKISAEESDIPQSTEMPPIKNTIPLLSSVMHKKPHEKVINGLGNILYGYACASRLFMQDWTGNVNIIIEAILSVSVVLHTNQCFETAHEAIDFAYSSANELLNISDELNLLIRNDVDQILESHEFRLAALSDVSALLHRGVKANCVSKNRLRIAIKKVDFYLSLVNECCVTIFKCN